jgi:competence protein ComEA
MLPHLRTLAERLRGALQPRRLLRALAVAALCALLAALGAGSFDPLPIVGSAQAAPIRARSIATIAAKHGRLVERRLEGPSPIAAPAPSATDDPIVLTAALAGAGPEARVAHPHDEPKKVVLNTATAAELCTLPGIGPKRAEQILALREKLGGRFRRLEDLRRVRGIGRKKLEQLRPLVVLDPPEPAPAPAPT